MVSTDPRVHAPLSHQQPQAPDVLPFGQVPLVEPTAPDRMNFGHIPGVMPLPNLTQVQLDSFHLATA